MINASKAFKNALAEGKILYEIVDITFADGRKKALDSEILVGEKEMNLHGLRRKQQLSDWSYNM